MQVMMLVGEYDDVFMVVFFFVRQGFDWFLFDILLVLYVIVQVEDKVDVNQWVSLSNGYFDVVELVKEKVGILNLFYVFKIYYI